ncbi:TonB-dependent receptor [Klebsiella pneumoniae]|uniref:TonB-dependent receptor n=1 Tax=Klebsiella pneumoniae TaxID=573 RepID=A0A377Z8K1_KLEPN|nr:TonB-dependent receptor [Klebsiella pneumoniae]
MPAFGNIYAASPPGGKGRLGNVATKSRNNNEYRIKSLALLVNLGIYGVAFPLSAAETATDDKNSAAEETMVVTAAEQNLQAPGVSTITADEIANAPRRATSRRSFAPCREST